MAVPDILQQSSLFLSHETDFKAQESLAVAVSGGPDSMALACALSDWSAAIDGPIIHALSVDHGLRAASQKEVQQVSQWLESRPKIQHEILIWQGEKPKTKIMEEAREARYRLMDEYCHQHDIQKLFVAHHQDDQAETFLIRLSKGSGLDGLCGMETVFHYHDALQILRPLLACSKQNLIDYCNNQNVSYLNDPSNKNTHFLRPRLREARDILEAEGLSTKRLSVTTQRLSRARRALDFFTDQALQACIKKQEEDRVAIKYDIFKSYPEEIMVRIILSVMRSFRETRSYNPRMEKTENLVSRLKHDSNFKRTTLGHCVFALKPQDGLLWVEKE